MDDNGPGSGWVGVDRVTVASDPRPPPRQSIGAALFLRFPPHTRRGEGARERQKGALRGSERGPQLPLPGCLPVCQPLLSVRRERERRPNPGRAARKNRRRMGAKTSSSLRRRGFVFGTGTNVGRWWMLWGSCDSENVPFG